MEVKKLGISFVFLEVFFIEGATTIKNIFLCTASQSLFVQLLFD